LRRYHEFSDGHAWKFRWMFRNQQAIKRLHGRPADRIVRLLAKPRVSAWAFNHYYDVAHPRFALPAPPPATPRAAAPATAAAA
jgi:hypothetical protein